MDGVLQFLYQIVHSNTTVRDLEVALVWLPISIVFSLVLGCGLTAVC